MKREVKLAGAQIFNTIFTTSCAKGRQTCALEPRMVTLRVSREGDVMGNGELTKWQPAYTASAAALIRHWKMRPACAWTLQPITCVCVSKSQQMAPLVILLRRFLYVAAAGGRARGAA